jgi:hypothetical protein
LQGAEAEAVTRGAIYARICIVASMTGRKCRTSSVIIGASSIRIVVPWRLRQPLSI